MTDNAPLNADDGMKMPLGKRRLRELIEDAWYDAPSASAGFGRIEVIIEQQIKANRKKNELQARLSSERDTLNTLIKAWNGTYDDANDILQLLIDNSRLGIKNLEQELEKL